MCNYLNPKNYIWHGLSFANRNILHHVEHLLAPDPDLPLRHPPIFFVGAPRSGSTLMIQVITDALDLGYISNRHCQWYGAPAIAELLFRPTTRKPVSNYQSMQGNTDGAYAPAECGQWWYRFFRRTPPYVTLHEVDLLRMLRFRQSIAALTNAFDRPLLFKNLYASLRIQAIAYYIPESLFIITHRNEVDNGHSLLEVRYKCFEDYETWWSMEPPEVETLKALPAHQQVIEQIRHIHATIERDLKNVDVPESRRFHICYEKFCENPPAQIDALNTFLKSNHCIVNKSGSIPKSFNRREDIRIDRSLYAAMTDYAQTF